MGTDNCVAATNVTRSGTTSNTACTVSLKRVATCPWSNCESCHGPGSLAIVSISEDSASNDARKVKCDTSTFLNLLRLPFRAQALSCPEVSRRSIDPYLLECRYPCP